MKSIAFKVWLLVFLVAGAAYGGFKLRQHYDRPAVVQEDPAPRLDFPIGDFTLVDEQGEEFHARELQGEVWVASFFYSDCPGACIRLNHQIADLLAKDLRDEPVRFVSITVDPQKDTQEVLAEYRSKFAHDDPERWIFLTSPDGRTENIERISEQFKVAYAKRTHSDRLLLVDRQGRLAGVYSSGMDADVVRFVRDVRKLLNESPPTEAAQPAEATSSTRTEGSETAARE